MRAVDANVLVRLTARDDPGQIAAAEAFIAGGAWVSQLVLAQTIWVLGSVYELNRAQLVTVVEILLNHAQVVLQDADAVQAALGVFRARAGVDFFDCLILEAARKAGQLPLGTFDRRLAKIDGAMGI